MKYLIILGDGMADHPIESINGRTPLMAAHTPYMDLLAQEGGSGLLETVPADMPPGSAVANLSVLGYDVAAVYQGRGVLEAASMGVHLDEDDLAMRCNLICTEDGRIKNHSAGHISTEDARPLISALNEQLGSDVIRWHCGISYRHLLIIKGGHAGVELTPPHDVPGALVDDFLPKAVLSMGRSTQDTLIRLIRESREILELHPVNQKRKALGKDVANSVWPWAAGHKPVMPTLKEAWGVTGAVISAVDLIQGIGVYADMEVIKVPGATGLYDTNYEGKIEAALDALNRVDLVFLHIEASDEAGHEGDVDLKIKTIEYLDQRVLKRALEARQTMKEPLAIALLPDHPTPCDIRTHVHDAVPFVISSLQHPVDSVNVYNESAAQTGRWGLLKGSEFMAALTEKK